MSLAYIGPVAVDFHGDPKFSLTAQPTTRGMRPHSISGIFTWTVAKQLSELVDNYDRRIPVGDQVGVLEDIWFTDHLLAEMRGLYLLTAHNLNPNQPDSLNDIVPMTLQAILLSVRQRPVVTRSARPRANDYGITGTPILADPFYGEFVTSPGGSITRRAYDPQDYDVERENTLPATIGVWIGPTATVVPLSIGTEQ